MYCLLTAVPLAALLLVPLPRAARRTELLEASRGMLSREELELQDVQRQMEEQLVEQFMQVRCAEGCLCCLYVAFVGDFVGVWGRWRSSWWSSSCRCAVIKGCCTACMLVLHWGC
jgi:hypothetical protein